MKIWILEDDDELRWLLGMLVEAEGGRVESMAVLRQAWRLVERLDAAGAEQPNAVISDYQLPDGLSYEWLARVRLCLPVTPILCVSAVWMHGDRAAFAQLGIETREKRHGLVADVRAFVRGLNPPSAEGR